MQFGRLDRDALSRRNLSRASAAGGDATSKALVTMWEGRVELDGFAPTMEGVHNAVAGLGRALSGPHDYDQIPGLVEHSKRRQSADLSGRLAVSALNRMLELGRPNSFRTAWSQVSAGSARAAADSGSKAVAHSKRAPWSSARHACSQARQDSAQTRQYSCMAAWLSHSAAQMRQASAQAISCASFSIGLGSVRREMMRAVVRHTSEQSRQVRMQQTRSAT
jgi:hypothetical protein